MQTVVILRCWGIMAREQKAAHVSTDADFSPKIFSVYGWLSLKICNQQVLRANCEFTHLSVDSFAIINTIAMTIFW